MNKEKIIEKIIEKMLLMSAAFAILIILLILGFILKECLPIIVKVGVFDFIFGQTWSPLPRVGEPEYGIFPIIISTIYVVIGAMAIAVPLGLGCAIFLAEIAPNWARNALKPVIEMLVGIPSIVLGFIGLMLLIPLIRLHLGGFGVSLLAGSIMLAIMTLPHITSISDDAIRAVPKGYKEASLSLGATHWQTITNVILPSARPGILASITLGMANAIGETMAVLMVVGNPEIPFIPDSILDPVRVLTSTIVIEMRYAVWGSDHAQALFAIGLVLFVLVAILNSIAIIGFRQRVKR